MTDPDQVDISKWPEVPSTKPRAFRLRYRYMMFFLGSLVAFLGLLGIDPDQGWIKQLPFGAELVVWTVGVTRVFVIMALAHFGVKSFFDYPEADGRKHFKAALEEHNVASALVILSRVLLTIAVIAALSIPAIVLGQDVKTHIPAQASTWQIPLKAEQMDHWRDMKITHYLPALIEHESCISLKHSKCWNPGARLKTEREEGAGLTQLTRTWHKDGTLRFDVLAELRGTYPQLRELSWSNVYQRPDLQFRGAVLKLKGIHDRIPAQVTNTWSRYHFMDASYNGGEGGLKKDRSLCALKQGCDPAKWFGHVEATCSKSLKPMYGTRGPCDINRYHVKDVFQNRLPKYEGWL